jgi:4-hydroxyphenylpyruvate dioxygenase-like putative hemolysin
MFDSIHHITYLVWDLASVESYFQDHFDLQPIRKEDVGPGRSASISYQIGPTLLRFSEPAHTATMEYEQLRRSGGPVISHIGLGVANLADRSRGLKEAGVDFTQSKVMVSPHGGYKLIDIAAESSCGMRTQNERFALSEMSPDSHLGIRLQLCEDIVGAGTPSNA